MIPLPIQQVAVTIFLSLVNYAIGKQVHKIEIIGVFDFIQVSTGNVNLHSLEEAVEIAINTCIRKDRNSQVRVAAFVTALYLQFEIQRAAQVGGSLLKCFGKSWFPHIKDRELRFALQPDSELENYLYNQICNEYRSQ